MATVYMLINMAVPVVLAIKINPYDLVKDVDRKDYGKHLLFPSSFAPVAFYPVAQVVSIVVAISALFGFSRKGGIRYLLSFLGLVGASAAVFLQCQTSHQPNYDKLEKYSLTKVYDGNVIFLDSLFVGMAVNLGLLLAPFITKNYDERVRLLQGSVIMYDAFRLICIRDFKQTWENDKKLILMHVFAGPVLILLNVMAFRNRKRRTMVKYREEEYHDDELTFAPTATPRFYAHPPQPRLQPVRGNQQVMYV
jgi:hypothetical protein